MHITRDIELRDTHTNLRCSITRQLMMGLALIGALCVLSPLRGHADTLIPADARLKLQHRSLKNFRGAPLNTAQLKGKVSVIVFWATWCEPCKAEIVHMLDLKAKNPQLELLLISTDNAQTSSRVGRYARKWMRKGARVLLDPDGSYLGTFNPQGSIPFTIIVDREERVAFKQGGYTIGDDVKIKEAVAELSK